MFLKILKYISGPLIGSLIGYFTNFIAVKMLFYPRKEVKVFGHRLPFTPGVIPKGKPRLAHAIGKAVGETLITKEDIEARILSPEISRKLTDAVFEKLSAPIKDSLISITNLPENMYEDGKNKIAELISRDVLDSLKKIDFSELIVEKGTPLIKESITNPMISMFLNEDMVRSVAGSLGNKIRITIDEKGLDYVKPFVLEKINNIDSDSVPGLLNNLNISDMMIKGILSSIIYKVLNESLSAVLNTVDISEIVENKINAMDIDELEKLILQVMKKELNAIVNLGALIGFILGLVNVFI